MKAIILAAGVGKRLGELSAGLPKCLLNFDGVSLLHRHIKLLSQLEVSDICIVTGYRENEIKDELARLDLNANIKTISNPDYESGSVLSLLSARTILESGEDFILMDADVLYHPDILKTLVTTQLENCFLLDRIFEAGDEPVKICVRDNTIVDFRKIIASNIEYDFQGESVGFFRFSNNVGKNLAAQCQHYLDEDKKDAPYEEAIRDLLLRSPGLFGFEDISGSPWIEIDFPEDVGRAENDILTRINK